MSIDERERIAQLKNARVHLFAVYSTVTTEIITGSTMPAHETGMLWLLENKSVLVENDLKKAREFSIDEIFFKNGMRSVIRLPLHGRGEIYGSFNLTSHAPYTFGKREQEVLEELTVQITVAIENSRLVARINSLEKE
ncbi:MAG: GAF domain-containing protein [Chloroflexota bacterium]|nr:GAF domain-containing protein [Chloroflexota bacterium]